MVSKDTSGYTPAELDQLRKEIEAIPWWHRIQVGPFVTPGRASHYAQDWIASRLPASLAGKSVLDIGAWDGYFSFLAEERGARRVLAVDNLKNPEAHPKGSASFELAKRVRKSKVEFQILDVYDCDRLQEKFDVILFLGVYYHLHSPIYALEKIRHVLAPGGSVFMEGMVRPGGEPSVYVLNDADYGPTNHSNPTVAAVERMALKAGFTSVRTVHLNYGGGWGPKLFGRRIRPSNWNRVMHLAYALHVRSQAYRGLFELR